MLDLNNYDLDSLSTRIGQENDLRVLVVESDPDLMILYTRISW